MPTSTPSAATAPVCCCTCDPRILCSSIFISGACGEAVPADSNKPAQQRSTSHELHAPQHHNNRKTPTVLVTLVCAEPVYLLEMHCNCLKQNASRQSFYAALLY
eukprot:14563-Heterococcus_DN1.PRE.3